MFEIGRVCLKIAGRDAGGKCVVVNVLDKNTVEIAGQVRRRRCNTLHLEPTMQTLDIKKGVGDAELEKALSEAGIELRRTKAKSAGARPRHERGSAMKAEEPKTGPATKPKKKAEPMKAKKPASKKE